MSDYQYTSVPQERLERSRFEFDQDHKTTFNAGKLIPFFAQPVIAGSTASVDVSAVIRTSSPFVVPVFDNFAINFWWFFVPNRLVYDESKLFFGEDPDYYMKAPRATYYIPSTKMPSTGWSAGSVADHFGLPTGVTTTNIANDRSRKFNALPFRGMAECWNEFFRDENSVPKALINKTSSDDTGASTGGNFLNTASKGGDLMPLCRPHDLFGACLPFLQKGDPSAVSAVVGSVTIPSQVVFPTSTSTASPYGVELKWKNKDGTDITGLKTPFISSGESLYGDAQSTPQNAKFIYPSNLSTIGTTLGTLAGSFNIADLRTSIAMQHLLEARGRAGSRYRETLNSIYGVEDTNPNLDVPTYLGGKRIPLSCTTVVQQNNPNDSTTTQLGSLAAFSHTGDYDSAFTYTALEHGFILGFLGVRTQKTYQQGVDRMWRMREITDFWNPYYAGLSDSYVRKDEIYFADDSYNNDVFGYQTSFYWENNRPNLVSGMFRSNYAQSLDMWHFADDYNSRPSLNASWLYDNSQELLDRCLSVSSSVSDQFLADINTHVTMVSIMPVNMIPGIRRV